MKKVLLLMAAVLLLAGCSDSGKEEPSVTRAKELSAVVLRVKALCGISTPNTDQALGNVDAQMGPSPVDVEAAAKKICVGK